MSEYIFRRCVIIAFFISSIVFTLSFFIEDWHYTHYHDVKVISEKVVKVHNNKCSDSSHDHYYIHKINVKWQGIDNKGNSKTTETQFEDEDDTDEGVSYKDIHKGIAKTHNCLRSCLTWILFIGLLIVSLIAYFTEDFRYDYSYYERKDIREWRYDLFCSVMEFFGYDTDILDIIYKEVDDRSMVDRIPLYEDLYYKYKELIDGKEKENNN